MINETWTQAVLSVFERLVGAEQAAELAASWAEHAARDKVEVTFLGPYSSGKSSLLRRLVVEGGGEVPDWLTVSGRRETFELNAVDVGDLTFTDVPGFAAGNALHDELAHDALALSDAFLLVVPPQLLTTDREFVGSVLSGQYFHGNPRPGVDAATIAVVAQADSMGIDPDDDPDGMRRLAERKRSELRAQLDDAAGTSLSGLQVFCVAADPYEEQARQAQPPRSAFDPYREWDGIGGLVAALDALPARHDELRRAAGFRYFCRMGAQAAAHADEMLGEMSAAAEELQARHTAWKGQKARVEAVIDAAEADLQAALVALAGELSGELGPDQDASRTHIDARMTAALDRWAARWDGELDLVLGEVGTQVEDRLGRPRANRTEEFLRSLASEPTTVDAPEPNSRVFGLLRDIDGELFTVARRTFELWAGEPFDKLVQEGRRARPAAKGSAKLADEAKNVTKKAKVALTLDAGLQMADALLTIASTIEAEVRQHELDAQLRRQREEAREQIERGAATAAAQIVRGANGEDGWRGQADAALARLRERLGLTEDSTAIDTLRSEVAARQQLASELRALVDEGAERLAAL